MITGDSKTKKSDEVRGVLNVFRPIGTPCLVSIIMPAFNAAVTISDAVRSALSQTETDLELIVIDDASTDATASIVMDIARDDSRVRVVTLTSNGGPGAARNAGLDAAQGRWIALLDADDLYTPSRLKRLIALAEANAADIVSDNLLITMTGRSAAPYLLIPPTKLSVPRQMHFTGFITGNSGNARSRHDSYGFMQPLFLRSFLERNTIRYDPQSRFGEDYLLCLKCYQAGARWWITPEAMYHYRVTANSATARQSSADLKRISLAEFALLSDPDVCTDPVLVAALRRHKAKIDRSYHYRTFTDALKTRQFSGAAAVLFTSVDSVHGIFSEAVFQFPAVIRKLVVGGYRGLASVDNSSADHLNHSFSAVPVVNEDR